MLDVRFSLQTFLADQLTPLVSSQSAPSVDSADSLTSSFPRGSASSRSRQPKRLSLYGCGVLLINPPYLLDALLSRELLPFLSTVLASQQAPADFAVQWLTPAP